MDSSFQQIKYEIDPEYLFSPVRGEGKSERAIVESYFKVNYTHRFNVGRITRPGKDENKCSYNIGRKLSSMQGNYTGFACCPLSQFYFSVYDCQCR